MKTRLRNSLRSSLPAYLNQTLNRPNRLLISFWLRHDAAARAELAYLQRLHDGIASSARRQAPKDVFERVRQHVQGEANSVSSVAPQIEGRRLATGMASIVVVLLALLAGAVVWLTIPPVISLEWSVSAGRPSEFRIYRARLDESLNAGDADFVLINEIPATSSNQPYEYADLQLLPGKRFLYRVDALDASGVIVKSNTTLGDSLAALPAQLVLFASALILFYGLAEFMVHGRNLGGWNNNDRRVLN